MEDNLFQENEDLKVEVASSEVVTAQKPSKKKSKKKVKDDCCGLSELQLKEAFKAVLYAGLLKQDDNKISQVQVPLALASKPCKDFFFTDFDSRPYTYSVNNKIKVFNNSGIEKYLIPAGTAYASSINYRGEAVISEIEFEEKNISFLSALLHLNRTNDLPFTLVLHTHHDLQAFAESFNADYFSLPGTNIADDYEVLKTAVESSRTNKNISLVTTGLHTVDKYRGDNERFLISKKIITREELTVLKEEAEEEARNVHSGIALDTDTEKDKESINLTNISYEPGSLYADLPDFELMCFAAGIALGGFKVNVSVSGSSFTYPFEKALSNFTAKNKLGGFPGVTVNAGEDEVKERLIVGNDVILNSEEPSAEDIKEEPGKDSSEEDPDSRFDFEQEEFENQAQQEAKEAVQHEESSTELLKDGEDLTVIIFDTAGSRISEALAEDINSDDFDAAVIKVTGNNYDIDIITRSLHNTGKALVVITGVVKRAPASELICEISENSFPALDAPPKRLILENGVEGMEAIINACEELNRF